MGRDERDGHLIPLEETFLFSTSTTTVYFFPSTSQVTIFYTVTANNKQPEIFFLGFPPNTWERVYTQGRLKGRESFVLLHPYSSVSRSLCLSQYLIICFPKRQPYLRFQSDDPFTLMHLCCSYCWDETPMLHNTAAIYCKKRRVAPLPYFSTQKRMKSNPNGGKV